MKNKPDTGAESILGESTLYELQNAVGGLVSLSAQFREIDEQAVASKQKLKSDILIHNLIKSLKSLIEATQGKLQTLEQFVHDYNGPIFRTKVDAELIRFKGNTQVSQSELVNGLNKVLNIHIPVSFQRGNKFLFEHLCEEIVEYDPVRIDYVIRSIAWELISFANVLLEYIQRLAETKTFAEYEKAYKNITHENFDKNLTSDLAKVFAEISFIFELLTGQKLSVSSLEVKES